MAVQSDTPRRRGDPDAPLETPVTPAEDIRSILLNQISWGAVLAGVVVALVTHLLLNLLGLGIGVASLNPTTLDNPEARTFSIAAGIWWTAAGVLASLAGGYAAGRLAGRSKESTAGWHGLITWAVSTLVIVYLLTSAIGNLLGGALNVATNAVGGLGRSAETLAQAAAPAIAQSADPFGSIERTIREGSGGTDPAALRDAAIAAVRAALTGDPGQAQAARESAAQAVGKAQNISIEEARTRVGQYEQQYRQAMDRTRRQAIDAADAATKVVSRGALFGVLALLLGALAGWLGGRSGAIDPTITNRFARAGSGRELK